MIRRILHLTYALIALFTIAMTCITKDFHNLILGAVALIIVYECSTFLLTYYDDALSVPESRVFGTTGDIECRIVVSRFIFGTNPLYIYSGDRKIAEVYRDSDVTISISTGVPVAITREDSDEHADSSVTLSPGSINYVSIQGETGKVVVDHYAEREDVDERRYSIEYEYLRSQLISMDKGGLSIAVTSIMVLMAIYFKL